jgi:hypothetical protein
LPFAGDPAADADADGVPALLEHALGTSETDASDATAGLNALPGPAGSLLVTIRRNLRAEDVRCEIELSNTIDAWALPASPPSLVAQMRNADHTATETWSVPLPPDAASAFVRVRVHRP